MLGANTINPTALAYIIGDNWQRQHIKQDVADVVLSGSPFSTWAGPLEFGTGASYRKEQVVATADPNGTFTDGWISVIPEVLQPATSYAVAIDYTVAGTPGSTRFSFATSPR